MRPITPEKRDEICKVWEAGERSINKIADLTNVSRSVVYRLLIERGYYKQRHRGTSKTGKGEPQKSSHKTARSRKQTPMTFILVVELPGFDAAVVNQMLQLAATAGRVTRAECCNVPKKVKIV